MACCNGVFVILTSLWYVAFFFFLILFYFIFGCVGSSFLCVGFPQLRQVGATPHRSAQGSHCRGLSCCGAQAPDVQAQQLWLTGPVAPQHVGSSQTRARTRVPCIGRQILNRCTTAEAPVWLIFIKSFRTLECCPLESITLRDFNSVVNVRYF